MENQLIQTPLTYSWDQIEVALQGIPEDFRVRFKNTFSFDCKFIAIKSMEDWISHADRGKNLWGLIAPKALLLGCDNTGEAFKAGRKPSNKKIFECTDGTILMFVIQAVENGNDYVLPNVQNTKFDANFVNTIFKRINNQIVALPAIEEIKKELQLPESIVNLNNWQLQSTEFDTMKKEFDSISVSAIEDAYAGVVTDLPANYEDIKAKIDWIENLNLTITYDLPNKIETVYDYVLKVKQIIALAIIRIKAGLNLSISNNENEYLALASQEEKAEESSKVVETLNIESNIQAVEIPNNSTVKLTEDSSSINTPQILGRGTTFIPANEEVKEKEVEVQPSKVENSIPTEVELNVEVDDKPINDIANSIVELQKEGLKEELKSEIVTDTPRPATAIPIKATMVSIDPETHKVEVKPIELERSSQLEQNDVATEVANTNKQASIAVPETLTTNPTVVSPEQAAHNANKDLVEINALADELEAFVNLDQFKGSV